MDVRRRIAVVGTNPFGHQGGACLVRIYDQDVHRFAKNPLILTLMFIQKSGVHRAGVPVFGMSSKKQKAACRGPVSRPAKAALPRRSGMPVRRSAA